MKAIRDDEENSDELREAAGFLLDDDTLFDFFESGEQQASSHRFQIGRNDLFIHYDNNATQADAYDAWLTLNG